MIRFNQTALLLSTLAALAAAPDVAPSPRVVRFMGAPAAETLASATRVEAFRLKDKRANEGQKALGGYIIEADGTEQGESPARRVAGLLLDEISYRFDAPRAKNVFTPRFGLRLWAKGRCVEVVFSPDTDELVVFGPASDDGSVRSAKANVAPAREALEALVRETLPDGK